MIIRMSMLRTGIQAEKEFNEYLNNLKMYKIRFTGEKGGCHER